MPNNSLSSSLQLIQVVFVLYHFKSWTKLTILKVNFAHGRRAYFHGDEAKPLILKQLVSSSSTDENTTFNYAVRFFSSHYLQNVWPTHTLLTRWNPVYKYKKKEWSYKRETCSQKLSTLLLQNSIFILEKSVWEI